MNIFVFIATLVAILLKVFSKIKKPTKTQKSLTKEEILLAVKKDPGLIYYLDQKFYYDRDIAIEGAKDDDVWEHILSYIWSEDQEVSRIGDETAFYAAMRKFGIYDINYKQYLEEIQNESILGIDFTKECHNDKEYDCFVKREAIRKPKKKKHYYKLNSVNIGDRYAYVARAGGKHGNILYIDYRPISMYGRSKKAMRRIIAKETQPYILEKAHKEYYYTRETKKTKTKINYDKNKRGQEFDRRMIRNHKRYMVDYK